MMIVQNLYVDQSILAEQWLNVPPTFKDASLLSIMLVVSVK